MAAILANKLFLRLLVAWFVTGIANGVPAALFLLYLRHGLEVTAAEEGMFIPPISLPASWPFRCGWAWPAALASIAPGRWQWLWHAPPSSPYRSLKREKSSGF